MSQVRYWFRLLTAALLRPLRTRWRLQTLGRYHSVYYPRSVRALAKEVARDIASHTPNANPIAWDFIAMPNSPPYHDRTLRIAGQRVDIKDLTCWWQNPPGEGDPEAVSACHRFHWAVEWLSSGLDDMGARLIAETIASWLSDFAEPRVGVAWQPYTVSERICNWITLLPVLQSRAAISLELRQSLSEALVVHVKYLVANLEYPAGGQINNHILNNARALYQAGALLGLGCVQRLGRALFERHLPTMIAPSGYLCEGSSHYHLLLTRSVLECAVVARNVHDDVFAATLEPIGERMLAAATRLFPPTLASMGDGPRIGDVSPDIPFDWFSPAAGCAWRRIWSTAPVPQAKDSPVPSIDDGWLALDYGAWTLRAFIHPARDLYPVGHGHPDFGSFWLAWRGHALVIDMGRLTYMMPDGHPSGVEAESHGVVLLDGKHLLRHGRGWRGVIAGEAMERSRCEFLSDRNGVRWEVIGKSGVCWQRTLEIVGERMVLTDRILGAVRYSKVSGSLLLGPNVVVEPFENGRWVICFEETMLAESDSTEKWSLIDSHFYPEYGVSATTPCLIWECAAKADIEVKLMLTPQAAS